LSRPLPEPPPPAAKGHRPGMVPLFHVVHQKWRRRQPLYPWKIGVARGIFTAAEWQHRKVPVGYDGDLVSFHGDLPNAMTYAEGLSRRILRVWLWPREIKANAEEAYCHVGTVPASRIEVVTPEWIAAVQAWRDEIAVEAQKLFGRRWGQINDLATVGNQPKDV